MNEPRDVWVQTRDARLCVHDYGGAGAPIVLLHGAGSNAVEWDLVGPLLTQRDFRVVALDQRGGGVSENGAANSDEIRRDDLAFVCNELGVIRPAVVGHSAGARVAVLFAAAGESSGLILGDWVPRQTFRPWETFEQGFRANPSWTYDFVGSDEDALGAAEASWSAFGLAPPQQLKKAYATRPLRRYPDGTSRSWQTVDEALEGYRGLWPDSYPFTPELWKGISCPIMLVTATRGVALTLEPDSIDFLREIVPNVRVEVIESGHMLQWEAPEAYASVIADFVSVSA